MVVSRVMTKMHDVTSPIMTCGWRITSYVELLKADNLMISIYIRRYILR